MIDFHKHFKADFDAGILFWKTTGKIAGYMESSGYRVVRVEGKRILVHRILFAMNFGHMPNILDHINRDKTDNRLVNLREATPSENKCNAKLYRNNKTGFKGVQFRNDIGKYRAVIYKDRKKYHLGHFDTAEEAFEQYKKHSLVLHKEFSSHS